MMLLVSRPLLVTAITFPSLVSQFTQQFQRKFITILNQYHDKKNDDTNLLGNPTSTISLSRFVTVVFFALRRSSSLPFNVATSSSSLENNLDT